MKLPQTVLETIMAKLVASSLEVDGVYGPCLVARDVANAALVSHDLKFQFAVLRTQRGVWQWSRRRVRPPASWRATWPMLHW